jgi:hypothetical protein
MFTNEHSHYASMSFPPKSLIKRFEQKDELDPKIFNSFLGTHKNLKIPFSLDLPQMTKFSLPKLSQIGRFTQNSQTT